MIVSLHVATGAAGGAVVRSRLAATVVGALLHAAGDRLPHHDIASRRFEIASGIAGVLLLAGTRGPADSATVGAIAASLPDVEHALRLPRPGGRKLFPSHRLRGWHRPGGVGTATQLVVAGVLLGVVAAYGLRPRG